MKPPPSEEAPRRPAPLASGPAEFPVVDRLADFDRHSGSGPERLLFNHRLPVLLMCGALTALLGWQARELRVNANHAEMIPVQHPFIANYLRHQGALQGLGNSLRVVVENPQGTVLDARYLETLRQINDELFLLPGVDRPYLRSLWTPSTRWMAVSEDGLEGGPVIDDRYDGSPESLERLRAHIEQSGEVGQLVANDWRSSMILMPLLEREPGSDQRLDYGVLARSLEAVRSKYQKAGVVIRVVGFAAVVGELIAGTQKMAGFFGGAVLITLLVLGASLRSARNALLVVLCSLTAVLWLLGLIAWRGQPLDPYSILVPFLIFAIGVSHGLQKMNGIAQDIGRGTHRMVAARYTFRRLFLTGLTALLAAASGFAVLAVTGIGVIQKLAWQASLGVALLVVTNLMMLPLLLSYVGVSPRAARHSLAAEGQGSPQALLRPLGALTAARPARVALLGAGLLAALALGLGRRLAVGDLDAGAPELAEGSRYNRDSAYVGRHYAAASDLLVVMVKTAPHRCASYHTLTMTDRLEERLRQLPGVRSTSSLAGLSKRFAVGMNEGNLKWYEIPADQALRNALTSRAPRELMSYRCDLLPLQVHLEDHRAGTLDRVVQEVQSFAAQVPREDGVGPRFLLAAGNAGIEAATNQVVEQAHRKLLFLVYGAMLLICLLTFRSGRAVACAAAPLALSALLCEALMVLLGIGVKVATMPVIAVGVGVGVDYALYVISVIQAALARGSSFAQAYQSALGFTGKVVALSAVTLAVAAASWVASPIKFQADMGLLLSFMFVANLLGTLILVPALGRFLLKPTAPVPPGPSLRTSAG